MLFVLENSSIRYFLDEEEIDTLTSFTAQHGLALSIYLNLSSPDKKEMAAEVVQQLAQARLRNFASNPEARASLAEDLDVARLYLGTKNNRKTKGVAIFSCASELFWRAYPLPVPVDTEVYLGSQFVVDPLLASATAGPVTQAEEAVTESEKMIA